MEEYFKNNCKIAFKLFATACDESSNQNILISPLSLQLCLASIYCSSSVDEQSSDVLKLLQLSTKTNISEIKDIFSSILLGKSDFFNINIFNNFYIQNGKTINTEFVKENLEIIKTEVNNIDFMNVEENVVSINNECCKKTEDKICHIVTANDFNNTNINKSSLNICNAASLNASWEISFHKAFKPKTSDGDGEELPHIFYLNNGEKILNIDMMECTAPNFKYGELPEYNIKIVELPYAGYYENGLSMLVLLPDENHNINELQNKLEEIDFFEVAENRLQETMIWIKLPKFKIQYQFDVLKVLKKLNETNYFRNDKIKFSNLIKNEPEMNINNIIHKAEVESNEIGTDSKQIPRHLLICSEVNEIVEFSVNRPFIYVIKDKNVIYFIGKVIKLP